MTQDQDLLAGEVPGGQEGNNPDEVGNPSGPDFLVHIFDILAHRLDDFDQGGLAALESLEMSVISRSARKCIQTLSGRFGDFIGLVLVALHSEDIVSRVGESHDT